jgi:endonuclease-8
VDPVPEGDTIHLAAARIRAALAGRVPDEIRTPQPRHRGERWPERLSGRAVVAVDARGKHLFLHFAGGLVLHSHLRMTGQWAVYGPGERWRRSPRRAWLVIRVHDREVVQFDGPVLELLTEGRARSDQRIAGLGPDVVGESFDRGRFLRRLREDDPTRAIGDALLDQHTVAGIGNVWKAESCFVAAVDPWRAVGAVRDEEALAIVDFARAEMAHSAREGFVARPRAVYDRAGLPCPRCGEPIHAQPQGDGNRMTFWCAACQH